jgi:uncharacterized glyoxalase superfamily protein PhnB
MDVYPSLTYRDVSAAMDFLQRAFGFAVEEVGTEEGGAVCYAAMRHGGRGWCCCSRICPRSCMAAIWAGVGCM